MFFFRIRQGGDQPGQPFFREGTFLIIVHNLTGLSRNHYYPSLNNSRMAPQEERKGKKRETLTDMLTELLAMALAGDKDFILCHETDEETNKRTIHVMTGRFVSPCMLRKLIGQAESQKDEGATLLSKPVKSARKKGKKAVQC